MGGSCSTKILRLNKDDEILCNRNIVNFNSSNSVDHFNTTQAKICEILNFKSFDSIEYAIDGNFDFVVFVCLLGPVGIMGIVVNVCAYFALRSVYSRNVSAIVILRALSIANILLLLVALLHRTVETIVRRNESLACYVEHYQKDFTITVLHAAADMTRTISVYCILLVTIDRYLTVYRPGMSRVTCKLWTVHVWIMSIFIFPILLYLPRFFDFDTNAQQAQQPEQLLTIQQNSTLPQRPVRPALHVVSKAFLAYRLLDLAVQSLVPVTLIAVLNALLIKAIRNVHKTQRKSLVAFDSASTAPLGSATGFAMMQRSRAEYEMKRQTQTPTMILNVDIGGTCVSKRLSNASKSSHSAINSFLSSSRSRSTTEQVYKRQAEERSILLTLVLVVSVFIILELPMLALTLIRFVEILFSFRVFGDDRNMALYKFSAVAQLFENLQACSSFFLYCFSYASFRRAIQQYLRCNFFFCRKRCDEESQRDFRQFQL